MYAYAVRRVPRLAVRLQGLRVGVRLNSSAVAAESPQRERMEYDVVIVGGGPAGLSTAIRLKQLSAKHNRELSVCVVEKGHEVGAHIVSGNVFEPRALNELIPDWKEKGAPLETPAKEDHFYFLTENRSVWMPTVPMLHNHGNYIISLSQFTRWLGKQAEEAGVEIFPGTPAAEVLFEGPAKAPTGIRGIATADVGIGKDGKPTDQFSRGMELVAKQTVFAEGARGSCSEDIIAAFKLREAVGADPQTYGIGIKEVWKIDKSKHRPGYIQHTLGWPLRTDTYGGSFLYHMAPDLVQVGFVIGLDYKNPYLNPYNEFQRWKHHPLIRAQLEGGECIGYAARVINEGGLQSVPKLTFPGGLLVGCSAGFLNVPKIKGTHMAMKSGMVAADAVFDALGSAAPTSEASEASAAASSAAAAPIEVKRYEADMRASWVWAELKQVRNFHPSFKLGLLPGVMYSGLSAYLLRGIEPWTFRNKVPDSAKTEPAFKHQPIAYPKPDGKLSFDILTNLARSGVNHNDNQPSHLRIKPGMEDVPKNVSFKVYAGPEGRFCPAKVYEYPEGENGKLVINAQNCVHCKTCSIKTPREFIKWTVPEAGGGGPA